MKAATRAEHLAWCKQRAHEALDFSPATGPQDTVASMISDLGKHPETKSSVEVACMLMLTVSDRQSAIRFIDGFN